MLKAIYEDEFEKNVTRRREVVPDAQIADLRARLSEASNELIGRRQNIEDIADKLRLQGATVEEGRVSLPRGASDATYRDLSNYENSYPGIRESQTKINALEDRLLRATAAPTAVFENPETRGQLLAALKESTKGLRDTEDKLLTSLRQRRSEILTKGGLGEAGAIGEEWGQGVGVPGVSGKYVPAQIIKDSLGIERVVSGPELAGMITERFGYARHAADTTWQQFALSKLATFSTVYRMGKASFDLGLQFLQLAGLLGIDFGNLISGTAGATADMLTDSMGKGRAGWLGENFMKPAGPRFTNTFLPATKATFWSFFDPEYSLAYWMKPENYATLSERARYGSLVQPSELFLGVDTVEQTLERLARWQGGGNNARLRKNAYMDMVRGKVATAAPWGKTAFKQSYGRADAAWSAGRNVAANELWKAYAPFAAKTGNLHDLARMTNLMTGVLSLKGMGTSSFKRNLLNALGFFSPRYTYAQFAMVGHLLKGNGYTAKQARQMVVGTIAFNTTFFTLAAMALGHRPMDRTGRR